MDPIKNVLVARTEELSWLSGYKTADSQSWGPRFESAGSGTSAPWARHFIPHCLVPLGKDLNPLDPMLLAYEISSLCS